MKNRSVPADVILPHISYRNLEAAIQWLNDAFGFVEHYRYGDPISGAQLHLGNAWIMVKAAKEGTKNPAQLGYGAQSLTIFVEDVDAHCTQARAAGAKIVEHPHETIYGEYQYAAEDLDGHHWLFSRHARDANPADWGARVKS
ncbi:MAG TPA: VOC family protein [Candidatus Acidoferrales bacterium]|nr:VOC family protein [Candidatus Acidoferrales bacterium]